MRRILLFLLSVTFVLPYFATHSYANELYNEVSCGNYSASARSSCDQCFDGGGKYQGDLFAPLDYFNAREADRIYWDDENPTPVHFQPLNGQTSWFKSNQLMRYPTSFVWNTAKSGRLYHVFPKNTQQLFLETIPGRGIKLASVANDNVDPNIAAARLVFVSKYRTELADLSLGPIITHRECVFYKPRYCGDGIKDARETCDPRDPAKTGHGNAGCDTNTCQPINSAPVCNNLIATPASILEGGTVNVTCNGTNADSYKIDCGNGQVFNRSTATCTYGAAGTKTPKCFVNGNITSPTCQKTVTVTRPVDPVEPTTPPSISVVKTDENIVFDTDGTPGNDTQTVDQGERAKFRITVTNSGPESLKNIKLFDTVEKSCATTPTGVVNLQGKNFTNAANAQVAIIFFGKGDHNNSILEPGESFYYTCIKPNSQSSYTNRVDVTGMGVDTDKPASAKDTTVIKVIPTPTPPTPPSSSSTSGNPPTPPNPPVTTPKITVVKQDDNARDKDGNRGGNDSQSVSIGDQAVFRITVFNTGTEDIRNVKITDVLASACATQPGTFVNLATKNFVNGANAGVNISVSGEGNHNDTIFQVGERFTYNCAKSNTRSRYTNVVNINGVGVTSGTPTSATDSTEVVIDGQASIQIIKQDANTADQDGQQFNDTQTVIKGESATFSITVRNTGSEDLRNIVLNDPLAAACGTKSGTVVNLEGGSFTNRLNQNSTINYTQSSTGPHNDSILQVGEEFRYTCVNPNTQGAYTNTVSVLGNGVISGSAVTDDDTTRILINNKVFDLALRKTLSNTTPGPFNPGDRVTFDIEVFNQGNVAATGVNIIDYIPTGLSLSDTSWNNAGQSARRVIQSIPENASKKVSITFTINSGVTGNITNFAEISGATGGIDCDSTPDSLNGNTNGEKSSNIKDNDIGSGCNVGEDEDDHDLETIRLGESKEFDLALRKILSPTTPGAFSDGQTIVFDIEVFNQGEITATNVVVTDYIPAGFELLSTAQVAGTASWTQTGSNAVTTIASIEPGKSKKVSIGFKIKSGVKGKVINFAEISSAEGGTDCDSTPDSQNGNSDGEKLSTGMKNDEIGGRCNDAADEDDHDLEEIFIGTYDLALVKKRVGNEELTIGRTVIFDIIVTNQGEVDSGKVIVTDYVPSDLELRIEQNWNLSGGKATQTISNIPAGESVSLPISFTIKDNAKSPISNFAEISLDSGEDCDSTSDSQNGNTDGEKVSSLINDNIGTGCDKGGDEDDHDIEVFPFEPPVFDLALRKTLSDMSQAPFTAGDTVIFDITVFNQGNLDAKNIQIVDYVPNGLTLITNNGWQTATGSIIKKDILSLPAGKSIIEKVSFKIDNGFTGTIENIAEISKAEGGTDCDSVPDTNLQNDGSPIDNDIGSRCNETENDEDDHDPEIIVVQILSDLELIKNLKTERKIFEEGDSINFNIIVKNTGNSDLENLKIEDHYPVGLQLEDSNWEADTVNNIAILKGGIAILKPNEIKEFTIGFKVLPGASGILKNDARICLEGDSDCTPQPPASCDDEDEKNNPDGCERITVGGPSINIDKIDANPEDQNTADDIQKVKSKGDKAVFRITVKNSGTVDLTNIRIEDSRGPACAGSITLPNTKPSSFTNFTIVSGNNDNIFQSGEIFSYECEVQNTQGDYTNVAKVLANPVDTTLPTVTDEDDSRVQIPSNSGSSSSGGGSTYQCTGLSYTPATLTGALDDVECRGNSRVEAFYLNCGGTIQGPVTTSGTGGSKFAKFKCSSDSVQCYVYDKNNASIAGNAWRTSNQCRKEGTPNSSSGGGSSSSGSSGGASSSGGGSFCGNGIIERTRGEQCDFGSGKNGPQGVGQAYCNNSCKIVLPNTCTKTGTDSDELCVLTFPNDGEIVFNPGGEIIIGHEKNPFDKLVSRPSIQNLSEYDLVFDQFCVQENGGKSKLLSGGRQCDRASKHSNGIIYPEEIVEFRYIPKFKTNKDEIPSNQNFEDTKLSTSLLHQGTDYKDAYFAKDLKVRVARPSVATTGGGASFVKNTNTDASGNVTKTTGDVSKITEQAGNDNSSKNKNFVGTSVTSDQTDAVSSFGEEIDKNTNTAVVEKVVDEKDKFVSDVKNATTVTSATSLPTTTVTFSSSTEKYNGLSNVYVIRGKNVNITRMDELDINGPTTFIVEGGGNLTITENIESSDNIAFIVRGGNIIIGRNVTQLDGTYVSIKDGANGGKITATAGTDKQLIVNGSLYGNIQDLVQNRNYISQGADGQLSVGTVVSFGSSIFLKPAPLVSQFVGEYLDSTKIAR